MGLFARKSDKELKADIRKYEAAERSEKRSALLESKRKETLARYREAKYRKPLAAARKVGNGLVSSGSVGLSLAGNAAKNLSRHDVSPAFRADFGPTKKGRGSRGLYGGMI